MKYPLKLLVRASSSNGFDLADNASFDLSYYFQTPHAFPNQEIGFTSDGE